MSIIDGIHPRLKEIIINKGWKELTLIQKKSIPIILKNIDCIIEAPTAGGKTEAVFFPVLTKVAINKKNSVQIIYIAPIKALLNDIEGRVKKYSEACNLNVFKWHGDVSQKDKIKQLRQPPQVLLTTPESLEAIILRKSNWAEFFTELETVIIDEAHNFALSDRGIHLVSLLERLDYQINKRPQRIAVTATIGNPEGMLSWLAGGNRRIGKRIFVESKIKKEKDFKIKYFYEEKNENNIFLELLSTLYKMLPQKKSIVFALSRNETELIASIVNKKNENKYDIKKVKVRTHHSNVSKYFREAAELLIKVKSEEGLNAIISTSTLELGIDIGELDQVIQVGNLCSSSSFLQRVGRTGRRDKKPQYFRGLCTNETALLLLAAVVNLGLKGKSESIIFPKYPYHILAHQIMCLSLQNHGINKNQIFKILMSASCFKNISKEDCNLLINFMIVKKILRDVDGDLIIGEHGERLYLSANWQKLFAVFDTAPLYDVFHNKNHIGTLDSSFVEALDVPFYFVLGGIDWKAININIKSRKINAEKTDAGDAPKWESFGAFDVPKETALEVGKILFSYSELNFLDDNAKECLIALKNEYALINWTENKIIVDIQNLKIEIYTYSGDKINRTLAKYFILNGFENVSSNFMNVTIKRKKSESLNEFIKEIKDLLNDLKIINQEHYNKVCDVLIKNINPVLFSKFSKCLPEELCKKTIADNSYDFDGLRECIYNSVITFSGTK